MSELLYRVGTIYIPVSNPGQSSKWYQKNLGAKENYRNEEKAILDLANLSVFLVKASSEEKLQFKDHNDNDHFVVTFEVNGLEQLQQLHTNFKSKEVHVGDIENRGHAGRNFVFQDLDGNKFDVWSELSPDFKTRYNIE